MRGRDDIITRDRAGLRRGVPTIAMWNSGCILAWRLWLEWKMEHGTWHWELGTWTGCHGLYRFAFCCGEFEEAV